MVVIHPSVSKRREKPTPQDNPSTASSLGAPRLTRRQSCYSEPETGTNTQTCRSNIHKHCAGRVSSRLHDRTLVLRGARSVVRPLDA